MTKNNRLPSLVSFLFLSFFMYVLWKNYKTYGNLADAEKSNAASRQFSSLASLNGLLLFFTLLSWLVIVFHLAGFFGYSTTVWKKNPRWASVASAMMEDEQQPSEYSEKIEKIRSWKGNE